MNVTVQIGSGMDMEVRYDSRCGYTALHGSLYGWMSPDDQGWFDRVERGGEEEGEREREDLGNKGERKRVGAETLRDRQ